MDNRSIFSKTGKGSLEITKKSIKLSSEERQALILVDGKTAYGELQEKLSRVPPMKLRVVFDKLVELELIREFVAKAEPPAAAPAVAVAANSVRALDGGSDLDFTALISPAKPAPSATPAPRAPAPAPAPAQPAVATPKSTADADEEARKFHELMFGTPNASTGAEAEATRKVEADRAAQEQAARQAAEAEARRQAAAEAEEETRKVREEILRKEQERKAAEQAAQARAAEEAARRKAEAERLAREQREREERERLERERAEKERLEREEEARRKAEAERIAREQREREERERLERERAEKERQEREEAQRRAAEEEVRRKAEAERLAREQREREERERLERERAEKERQEREQAQRRAAEEEARRKAAAEQHAREEQELEARHREEREKLERSRLARGREEQERAAAAAQAAASLSAPLASAAPAIALVEPAPAPAPPVPAAATEISPPAPTPAPAAADTGSLDFNAEAKAAFDADLDFAPASSEQRRKAEVDQLLSNTGGVPLDGATPLTGGGPDTFGDTGSVIDPFTDDSTGTTKEQEAASRKEIEQEAKERAKAEAKAQKEAEREAKRLAKENRVKVPGRGPSIGVIIAVLLVFGLVGGVGYLMFKPIDKAAIEQTLSERLGEPVTVASAKFSPFPPELTLGGMTVGALKLGNVVARPDPSSLISDHKVWKSVEVSGLSLSAEAARGILALATRDAPKIAASRTEIQKVRITDMEITGLPVSVPKFNIDALLSASGGLKQVTLATTDDKVRALLQPDEKGWLVDFESRGLLWPVGPKVAWESIRGKGVASAQGIKFEDYSITQFGGTSRGAGELSWNDGWKFNGNLDTGGLESELIAKAFYDATPVSGGIEGKLAISMSGTSLARMLQTPQIDGVVSVNKAIVKGVDLARTAQTGAAAPGSTRFSDFSATIAASGGRLQLKDIKGVSGLLTVSGLAEVGSDKALGGALTVELGVGGSRAKANIKLSGTVTDPKLSK